MKTIGRFEKKFRDCERLTIAVFKDGRDKRTDAALDAEYPFEKAAPEDWTITELKRKRLSPNLPGYDFKIYDSLGQELHGRTLLRTARFSKRR